MNGSHGSEAEAQPQESRASAWQSDDRSRTAVRFPSISPDNAEQFPVILFHALQYRQVREAVDLANGQR